MSSSKVILLNTIATYVRSVIAAGLALFSGRWVLAALGASDFGLFNVVGAIIVFIGFLNGVLSASASRHMAFAIGRGDSDEVNGWFNTALNIHCLIPIALIALGLPIGEYCVRNVFTIPPDRISACLWVFRMSLLTTFVSMVSVPYTAMFSAKQCLTETALWGSFQSLLNFAFAYVLTLLKGDLLLVYAGFGMLSNLLLQGILILRARALFPECRCRFERWFDRKRFAELFSFAAWSLFGTIGFVLRNQGSAILLNLRFGPRVNAAFGISNTVLYQTSSLSTAMMSAITPEMTAREGRGDRTRMIDLAIRACKFSSLLVMLFAIPLLMETKYILTLWLREPPLYTSVFCRLMLFALLVEQISIGHAWAVYASGKIAVYQFALGLINGLTLPLAWVLLSCRSDPALVAMAMLFTGALIALGRVLLARHQINISVRRWIGEVLLPCMLTGLLAAGAAALPTIWLSPSLPRLIFSILGAWMMVALLGWAVVLRTQEKTILMDKVHNGIGLLNLMLVSSRKAS